MRNEMASLSGRITVHPLHRTAPTFINRILGVLGPARGNGGPGWEGYHMGHRIHQKV